MVRDRLECRWCQGNQKLLRRQEINCNTRCHVFADGEGDVIFGSPQCASPHYEGYGPLTHHLKALLPRRHGTKQVGNLSTLSLPKAVARGVTPYTKRSNEYKR